MKRNKQLVVAHRGASGLVEHENTIEAFQKAIDVGSDAIETDIRITLDGQIVVFHDESINGQSLKTLTYLELLSISNKIGFHIPTLEEALIFVKGKILIDIEFKEAGYEKEVIDIIHKYLSNDEFYVRSFFDDVLIKIKKIDSKIITILLLGFDKPKNVFLTRLSELFPLFRIIKTNCDMVSPYYRLLILGFIFRMRILKKPVSVWTVNDENMMRKLLIKKKVDAIVTNYPDIALRILNRK